MMVPTWLRIRSENSASPAVKKRWGVTAPEDGVVAHVLVGQLGGERLRVQQQRAPALIAYGCRPVPRLRLRADRAGAPTRLPQFHMWLPYTKGDRHHIPPSPGGFRRRTQVAWQSRHPPRSRPGPTTPITIVNASISHVSSGCSPKPGRPCESPRRERSPVGRDVGRPLVAMKIDAVGMPGVDGR